MKNATADHPNQILHLLTNVRFWVVKHWRSGAIWRWTGDFLFLIFIVGIIVFGWKSIFRDLATILLGGIILVAFFTLALCLYIVPARLAFKRGCRDNRSRKIAWAYALLAIVCVDALVYLVFHTVLIPGLLVVVVTVALIALALLAFTAIAEALIPTGYIFLILLALWVIGIVMSVLPVWVLVLSGIGGAAFVINLMLRRRKAKREHRLAQLREASKLLADGSVKIIVE